MRSAMPRKSFADAMLSDGPGLDAAESVIMAEGNRIKQQVCKCFGLSIGNIHGTLAIHVGLTDGNVVGVAHRSQWFAAGCLERRTVNGVTNLLRDAQCI